MRPLVAFLLTTTALFSTGLARGGDALDHWQLRNATPINRVRFLGSVFVAVGPQGAIVTSPDGTNWTTQSSGTTASLYGVAYDPFFQIYCAVGDSGTILRSADLIHWNSIPTTNTGKLSDITRNNSRFIAVSEGGANVLRSSDGLTWAAAYLPYPSGQNTSFYSPAICSHGPTVVVMGNDNFEPFAWTSLDSGITWTRTAEWVTPYTTAITFANQHFLSVGWEGLPLLSTDFFGTNWQTLTDTNFNHPGNGGFPMVGSDVTFGNGTFLIARSFFNALQNTGCLISTNGTNWQTRQSLPGVSMDSVAFGNGVFVTAGSGGIYVSRPVSVPEFNSMRLISSNQLSLQVSGGVGTAYRLQTSTNLTNWSDFYLFTPTLPTTEFPVAYSSNTAHLFYRVVTP